MPRPRARAAGGPVRVTTIAPEAPIVHMMKETRPADKVIVTTCGVLADRNDRTTGFASRVTCPMCRSHPGVSG